MKIPQTLAVLSLSLCSPVLAQLPPKDTPTINADAILRELDAIEKATEQGASSKKQLALNTLASGLSNPSEFYQKAVEALEFEGKSNKGAIFQDWKREHGDLLKSTDFKTAITMTLTYMIMSIRAKDTEKPELFAAESIDYAKKLAALPLSVTRDNAPNQQKQVLNDSIKSNIFSRWLGYQGLFPDKDWCDRPGDLGGILEDNVRKVMREKKDPNIASTWDMQITLEAGRVTDTKLDASATKFNTGRRPELLFLRAKDLIAVGLKNRGVTEMLALAKANPQHRDFKTWATEIREQLKEGATPEPTTTSGFGETEPPLVPVPPDTSPQ